MDIDIGWIIIACLFYLSFEDEIQNTKDSRNNKLPMSNPKMKEKS